MRTVVAAALLSLLPLPGFPPAGVLAQTVPAVTISGGSAVVEGTRTGFFVNLSQASTQLISVNLEFTDAPGADFVTSAPAGAALFNPGATQALVSFDTVNDNVDEPSGPVMMKVLPGTGYTVGDPDTASIWVADNDGTASLEISSDSLTIDEDDQGTFTVALETIPSGGAAVVSVNLASDNPDVSATASLTFTTNNWYVPQTVTVSAVSDDDALDDTATITLSALPALGGANYNGVTGSVSVTVNDNDQSLTASGITQTGATLTLGNGPGTWYHRRTAPSNGACSSAQTGTTAALTGLTAGTAYTWKAYSDSSCNTELASVDFTTLTPTNSAPVFNPDTAARSVAENAPAGTAVGAAIPAATDADNDSLTYSMGGTNAASFDFNTSTRQISTRSGVTYDHETKSSYTVTVTATDGTASDVMTVTITVTDVNEPPAAPGAPTVTATSGSTTGLDVSWSAPANAGKPNITSYDVQYRQSGSGSFTNGPQNVSGTGTSITGLAANTAYEVQVRATNAEGDGPWSASGTGTTANGSPTVASAIPDRTATVGAAFTYRFPAGTFTDPDGHPLTYTARKSDGTALPSWLTFNAGNRTFSGTPAAGDTGTVTVRVTANDGNGGTVSDDFDIVVSASTGTSSVLKIESLGDTPVETTSFTVNEGESGDVFQVSLKEPPPRDFVRVAVYLGPTTGSAHTHRDFYRRNYGTPQPVRLRIAEDDDHDDETLTVTLRLSSGQNRQNPRFHGPEETVTVTVLDNDDPPSDLPTVTISGGNAVTEGTAASFTVSRTGATASVLTVLLSVSEDSSGGRDFVASGAEGSKQVTIPAGSRSETYTVATTPDTTDEPDGSVTVSLRGSGDYTSGSPSSASVAVNDDDGATLPVATFQSAAQDIPESQTRNARVVLTPAPTSPVTVSWTVAGTATSGTDYTAPGTSATMSGRTADVTIATLQDQAPEADETVILTLVAGTGYTVGSDGVHTATIVDDDGFTGGVTVTPTSLALAEGHATNGSKTYTVVLDADPGSGATVTVTAASSDSGAATVDTDSGTNGNQSAMIFTGGGSGTWSTVRTVTVTAVDDGNAAHESLSVTHAVTANPASNPYHGITAAPVSVTITDDDESGGGGGGGSGGGGGGGGGAPTNDPPPNSAPTVENPIPDRTATAGAAFGFAFPANAFADADGDPLSYAATLSNGLALPGWLSFDASTRTFSGTPAASDAPSRMTVRVTATDDGTPPLSASTDFLLTVEEDAETAAVKGAVRPALASVARRSLTSALENIGARMAAAPATGLALAGHAVPLKGPALPLEGSATSLPGPNVLAAAADVAAPCDGAACGMKSRPLTEADLLGGSSLSVNLGDGNAVEGDGPAAPLWAVWARGDLGTFEGGDGAGTRHEGELRAGWVGIDARAGPWVAGIAVSRSRGEAEYVLGPDGRGALETDLTSVFPYAGRTFPDGLALQAVLGAGTGEARHLPDDDAETETAGLDMRMASLGMRKALPPLGGFGLALRGDASLARLETDPGPQAIAGLRAESRRVRLGLEASRTLALEGGTLTPFLVAALRRDGGDGLSGTGLEIAGGLRWASDGVLVEARGRWLAVHAEEHARERGLSVTARTGPGADGRGPWLELSSRRGADAGGATALWREGMPDPAGDGGASVDARAGWGVMSSRGLVTPFAEAGAEEGGGRRLRSGIRFDARRSDLGAEVTGERRDGGADALSVRLDWRF